MNCAAGSAQGLTRQAVFSETELPNYGELASTAARLARDWTVGRCAFLNHYQVCCEAEYKRRMMEQGAIMQHAHMGFRDKLLSERAFNEIFDQTASRGAKIDRYGICLDWSMGYPADKRNGQLKGTGLILDDVEDFARLTHAAPVAAHFGDFMLGFPAALENTQYALAAGSTVIGNLGQYFTFRLPGWSDDVATTRSTLSAIALMAAQPEEVLVHSNLDDGFAAVFQDLACALGAAKLECYLVETLMGGKITHCYGHHYHDPVSRFAFQKALAKVSPRPGSMVYGNTVSYQGNDAQNYASMAGYLLVDIIAQKYNPSGHGINPVPVTENLRIPSMEEIINAQLAGARLVEVGLELAPFFDMTEVDRREQQLLCGGEAFFQNVLKGFEQAGIDVTDPVEMFLAIRRIGGKRLEHWFGPGEIDSQSNQRTPKVASDLFHELKQVIQAQLHQLRDYGSSELGPKNINIVVATTDVHEHSKLVLEGVFSGLGLRVIDGGVSSDPHEVAEAAEQFNADVIALSTYNGIALSYFGQLMDELNEKQIEVPVLIGGQINEIPEDSESSLPVDVEGLLTEQGAVVCHQISDAMPTLLALSNGVNE